MRNLVKYIFILYRHLHSKQELTIDLLSHGCDGQSNEINYLEHVEIQLNMDYTKRGDLSIDITSAMGKNVINLSVSSILISKTF